MCHVKERPCTCQDARGKESVLKMKEDLEDSNISLKRAVRGKENQKKVRGRAALVEGDFGKLQSSGDICTVESPESRFDVSRKSTP